MNLAKTSLAFLLAVLLPGIVFVTYTELNIHDRYFVEWLGCGCQPFVNTNHLSWLICHSTLLISALLWWPAMRSFTQPWRTGSRIAFTILSLWFLRFFMMRNAWL